MTDSPLVRTMVGANPRHTALRVVVLIVSAYIVFGHLLMPIRGFGVSMEPTIEEGDDDYFVVGDNRGMEMAQHEFGTATRGRLIGPRIF